MEIGALGPVKRLLEQGDPAVVAEAAERGSVAVERIDHGVLETEALGGDDGALGRVDALGEAAGDEEVAGEGREGSGIGDGVGEVGDARTERTAAAAASSPRPVARRD